MRVHCPKLHNKVHTISLRMFLLLQKDQTFIFHLLLLQLVLCRLAALKVSHYIIHSADYILFRSFEISKDT